MDKKNKSVFGHLNIKAIRNKFELLNEVVKGNVEVLMMSEPGVDDSFCHFFLVLHTVQIRIPKMEILCYMLEKIFQPIIREKKINQQKAFMYN